MGTYIFIGDIADYISGAPIYQRNKAIHLEESGWKVVILPYKRGQVFIKDISRFANGSLPFLRCRPSDLRRRDLDRCLGLMVECVGEVRGPCIVESGTDWTAYWGELLAERLAAKHFIFMLDEFNLHVHSHPEYFWWKYQRGEMAGISAEVVLSIFGDQFSPGTQDARFFHAYCSNSIENYNWTESEQWDFWDFNIGSIGRLDKVFVSQIGEAVKDFARLRPNLQIGLYFFGGSTDDCRESLLDSLRGIENLHVYVSGYLWPLPLDVLRRMQVFVGGAAGARVPSLIGAPSLCMDVHGNGCIGFYDDLEREGRSTTLLIDGGAVDINAQLEAVLCGEKEPLDLSYDEASEWRDFCEEYDRQVNYVMGLNFDARYWSELKEIPHKNIAIRIALRLLGVKPYLYLKARLLGEAVRSMDSNPWEETCR